MFKRSNFIAAIILFSAALTGAAHAGLIGVKEIRVTLANSDTNLQIVEFQAFESDTGTNVALSSLGTVATASSMWSGGDANPGKAIDGQYADKTFPNMYHSSGQETPWLDITFNGVKELNSVTMFGRSDCCSFRDVYNLNFFDFDGALLYSAVLDADNTAHMGNITLPDTAATAVPEPASIALLGMGLLGLALNRRKLAIKN